MLEQYWAGGSLLLNQADILDLLVTAVYLLSKPGCFHSSARGVLEVDFAADS